MFPPSDKQRAFMDRHNLNSDADLNHFDAWVTIGAFVDSRRRLPPTARQEQLLRTRGLWRPGMTRGEAFDLIARIKKE